MPYLCFESGQLSAKTKAQLIAELTQVSADITKIPKEYFLVSIKELPDDSIAVGGRTVSELKSALNSAE